MRKMVIYTSRPRKLFGSNEDVSFLDCMQKAFNSKANLLVEGHDFNYIKSIDMFSKIEKIVSTADKVMVLHIDGVIDQNQYYEVMIALTHNITVLAKNANSKDIKRVDGFEKYFESTINKGAILKLTNITPN